MVRMVTSLPVDGTYGGLPGQRHQVCPYVARRNAGQVGQVQARGQAQLTT